MTDKQNQDMVLLSRLNKERQYLYQKLEGISKEMRELENKICKVKNREVDMMFNLKEIDFTKIRRD